MHFLTTLFTFSLLVSHPFLPVILLLLLHQRSSLAAVLESSSMLWWLPLSLGVLDHSNLPCRNISVHRRTVTIKPNYNSIFQWTLVKKKNNHCTLNVMLQCFPGETFSSYKVFFFKDFLWFHFRLTNSKEGKINFCCYLFNYFVWS